MKNIIVSINVLTKICTRVCVCVRDGEREREKEKTEDKAERHLKVNTKGLNMDKRFDCGSESECVFQFNQEMERKSDRWNMREKC